jgi:hypothetical protein
MINADALHCVTAGDDGHVVVLLRSAHPLTGEPIDCLGFRLSPHHALFLSERLRREALDVIAPAGQTGELAAVPICRSIEPEAGVGC